MGTNGEFDDTIIKKKVALYAKIIQAFFLALFMLGFSTGVGDYTVAISLPFGAFSVTSMTYGILGMLGCEFISRRFAT